MILKGAFNEVLEEAFILAESRDDKTRAADASSSAMLALAFHGGGGIASWTTPESARWVQRADLYSGPDSVARVWADLGTGETLQTGYAIGSNNFAQLQEGTRKITHAIELARLLDNSEAFWFAAISWLTRGSMLKDVEKRQQMADELAQRSHAGVSGVTLAGGLCLAGCIFLESGRRQQAEDCFRELNKLAERTSNASIAAVSEWANNIMTTLDGHLEQVVAAGYRSLAQAQQFGGLHPGISAIFLSVSVPMFYLGKAEEAVNLAGPANFPLLWLTFQPAFMGYAHEHIKEVKEIFDRWVADITDNDKANEFFNPCFIASIQTAILVSHQPAVELLYQAFANSKLKFTGFFTPVSVARYLGIGATFLGKYGEARHYYLKAIDDCLEIRHRPELALSRLQLAELILEHYADEKVLALEHLDFAIQEFREMKMQPSLERALRQKKILKA